MICDPKSDESYGFLPAMRADKGGPMLTVEKHRSGWVIHCAWTSKDEFFPLPATFDPTEYQQFRFRRRRGRLEIQHEADVIGEIQSNDSGGPGGMIGLYGHRVIAAFDMVRVTALG
jgi:hypothetical protein